MAFLALLAASSILPLNRPASAQGSGTLYGCTGGYQGQYWFSSLYEVNPSNGDYTLIGNMTTANGDNPGPCIDMASYDGILYASFYGGAGIYVVDTNNATIVPTAASGFNQWEGTVNSSDYGIWGTFGVNSTGSMFGWGVPYSEAFSNFYSIDPATSVVEQIGTVTSPAGLLTTCAYGCGSTGAVGPSNVGYNVQFNINNTDEFNPFMWTLNLTNGQFIHYLGPPFSTYDLLGCSTYGAQYPSGSTVGLLNGIAFDGNVLYGFASCQNLDAGLWLGDSTLVTINTSNGNESVVAESAPALFGIAFVSSPSPPPGCCTTTTSVSSSNNPTSTTSAPTTTTSSSHGGVPEFPLQVESATAVTLAVAACYVLVRRSAHRSMSQTLG